ncbi:hypothetical protein STEG23_015507, partial [Scotinomys teguina]
QEDVDEVDVSSVPEEVLRNIEADTYWCMSKLLDGIQDNYTFAQPGIQMKVKMLEELVSRIDERVHRHLDGHEVRYLQFAFRWMNNLLMRELPLRCTIRLWDTYQVLGKQTHGPCSTLLCTLTCGVDGVSAPVNVLSSVVLLPRAMARAVWRPLHRFPVTCRAHQMTLRCRAPKGLGYPDEGTLQIDLAVLLLYFHSSMAGETGLSVPQSHSQYFLRILRLQTTLSLTSDLISISTLTLYPSSPLTLYPSSPLTLYPPSPLTLYPSSPLTLYPPSPLTLYPSSPLTLYPPSPLTLYPSSPLTLYPPSPLTLYPSSPLTLYPPSPLTLYPSSPLTLYPPSPLTLYPSSPLTLYPPSPLTLYPSSPLTLYPPSPLTFFTILTFFFTVIP